MSNNIQKFYEALSKRVQERDEWADVQIIQDMATAFTGDYKCVITAKNHKEVYAFNPQNQTWMVCY